MNFFLVIFFLVDFYSSDFFSSQTDGQTQGDAWAQVGSKIDFVRFNAKASLFEIMWRRAEWKPNRLQGSLIYHSPAPEDLKLNRPYGQCTNILPLDEFL